MWLRLRLQRRAPRFRRLSQALAIAATVAAIGCYYWWAVRATGSNFYWHNDLPGYYNYLGRALAAGKLHLPIDPSPELLALPNPWDPQANDPYRMHDLVLFGGRYYLYHGAGPAVLLFVPWRLITGHDLPENFAVALFCFGGFLFLTGALLRVLTLCDCMPGPFLLAAMLLALGLCHSAPYLCNRIWVYEIPIAGGYFCVAGAMFFLARGLSSRRPPPWLFASGMMFGLAISCRPHLGLVGAICLAVLITCLIAGRRRGLSLDWRGVAAFSMAFCVCGAAVALYNYARFGNPFEFGLRYLLAGGTNQQGINLSAANLIPGLYYMLASPPGFSLVFPWVRLQLKLPFGANDYPLPQGYFLEPTVGALFLAPVIIAAFFPLPRHSLMKAVFWRALMQVLFRTSLWSCIAVLLFVAATGFTTQRYMVDFLPLAVFAAILNLACQIAVRKGSARTALSGTFGVLTIYAVVANLALGITGPYDDMLAHRPLGYVRIANWFSPVERFRPLLNPSVRIDMDIALGPETGGSKQPLLTIGGQAFRHIIYVEHWNEGLLLTSHSDVAAVADETAVLPGQPFRARISYDPQVRRLRIEVDERVVVEQVLQTLVTAPEQVVIGENRVYPGLTAPKFSGRIHVREKVVRAR